VEIVVASCNMQAANSIPARCPRWDGLRAQQVTRHPGSGPRTLQLPWPSPLV